MPEKNFPPKQQQQPGERGKMRPKPVSMREDYRGGNKLEGKCALITGGDSGIGRAVAILFAQEGADIGIVYKEEHDDAEDTKNQIERFGGACLLISGDVGDESFCEQAVKEFTEQFGGIDILVNNAGEQHERESITEIGRDDLIRTFSTNIFAMFYMVKYSLPHMKEGGAIINTTSVTAYQGHPTLLDYATTKGAIVAFTRSLSLTMIERGIRVNAVAPGPVWTPLTTSTFDIDHVQTFGSNTPMKRAGQPVEIAPSYLFLATSDSSYMNGQVLHPNGGRIVNG